MYSYKDTQHRPLLSSYLQYQRFQTFSSGPSIAPPTGKKSNSSSGSGLACKCAPFTGKESNSYCNFDSQDTFRQWVLHFFCFLRNSCFVNVSVCISRLFRTIIIFSVGYWEECHQASSSLQDCPPGCWRRKEINRRLTWAHWP